MRILNLLKDASAQAAGSSTDKKQPSPFELDVSEIPPTADQLKTILDYVEGNKSMELVDGAKNEGEAVKRLKEDPKRFKAPVVRCLALCKPLSSGTADSFIDGGLE